MEMGTVLLWLFAGPVWFFLIFPGLEILLSRFRPLRLPPPTEQKHSFGIVITAYRNWEITLPLVESLLAQRYAGHFHIYVVADACIPEVYPIQDPRLTVLWPQPALNLKAKSIIHATRRFVRAYDYIVVFDADNLAHPDYLYWINRYAAQGHTAVQGQRTAKNLNSLYARADAAGEFYKNYTDRELPYRLGSSAVISGSGMAVRQTDYLAYLQSPEIEEGQHLWKKMLQEDKILQNHLLRRPGRRIAYAPQAVVYDEKVDSAQAVETQRSRWLYSYFQNIPNSLDLLRRGLTGFNFNQFWFGLVTIAPPLVMQVLLAGIFTLIGLLWYPLLGWLMLVGGLIFVAMIPLSLYLSQAPASVQSVFWKLPLFAWRQLRAMFKMRDPNKNFKHTEHRQVVKLEDVDNQPATATEQSR